MQLLTLAPVHIGSGEYYYPKEYIFENDTYYFPEMDKLYASLKKTSKNTLSDFENYLLSARTTSRLVDFLRRQNITQRDFGGYSIRATGLEKSKETKGKQLNEIATFIKNPYKKPYIPGSSLKGAIRTILANELFKTDDVPDEFYHSIRVSDSEPLKLDDLIIVQKIDYSNPNKKNNELPLFREALAPLTIVKFTITCEGEEAQEAIEKLKQYAYQHYQRYEEYFSAERPKRYKQSRFSKNILYLGGGTGFWTKTIINQARPPKGPAKMRMVGKGVHKLTRAQEKSINKKSIINNTESMYEMGKCLFQIIEK